MHRITLQIAKSQEQPLCTDLCRILSPFLALSCAPFYDSPISRRPACGSAHLLSSSGILSSQCSKWNRKKLDLKATALKLIFGPSLGLSRISREFCIKYAVIILHKRVVTLYCIKLNIINNDNNNHKSPQLFFYSSCREEMFWSWNSKAECDFRALTSANITIKKSC